MFSNIGEKIKKLSKIVCWIGIISCVIVGIIMLATYEDAYGSAAETAQIISGIAWIVVGPLASWIGSFLLYGFGELICSQKNSERYLKQLCKNQSPNKGAGEELRKDSDFIKDTNADTVAFGTYPQTEEGTDNTPIEWEVLERDGDKALLISKYALDCAGYNTKHENVTWETCTLRKWLNNDFYNRAFSEDEKKNIVSSKVTAEENPKYKTNPGNDTVDNVFLLSSREVCKYFDADDSLVCAPTAYAVKNGAYADSSQMVDGRAYCWWWLRSPSNRSDCAVCVCEDGSVGDNGIGVANGFICVRPCVWVRLS